MFLQTNFNPIVDILTIVLGTYGAIKLVGSFVELDHFPSLSQFLHILRKCWKGTLALLIANTFFFYRVYNGLVH
jgi:hypothetical protein